MRSALAPVIAATVLALSCAATSHARVLRVERTPAGVVLDWTGGSGPSDVIALDLAQARDLGAHVDLGQVRSIECGSADRTTRGGHEDAATQPGLIAYLVGSGGDFGPASTGKSRLIGTGGCEPGGELTQAQFCTRWRADSRVQIEDGWDGNPDPDGCDPGTLDPRAIEDALVRTNLYRWMCGLAPVVEDPVLSAKAQAGAVLLRDLGYLTHQPEPGPACYTTDGDTACGSSNISAGYPTLAASVDAYLADFGISSLGHRRWLLHPPLQRTGFGFVEGAGSYGVQWIIGTGSTQIPAFVAWPSASWFPGDALVGRWSFSVRSADFSSATVSVTRLSDGRAMEVTNVGQLPNGSGWNCLAYDVPGVMSGHDYRVVVDGVQNVAESRYEYVTKWCDCPIAP